MSEARIETNLSAPRVVFPLPAEMQASIIDHAMREAPRECCGIVAGREGRPLRLYPTTNIAKGAAGNRFYEIDPAELIELEFRELPKESLDIVAIYHSHPASRAYPSSTDVELAFWPGAVYLICSLEDSSRPYVRGFTIRDGNIDEVALAP